MRAITTPQVIRSLKALEDTLKILAQAHVIGFLYAVLVAMPAVGAPPDRA